MHAFDWNKWIVSQPSSPERGEKKLTQKEIYKEL